MSECPKPQKKVKGVRKPLRSKGRKCKICRTRHFGYGDCCSIKCAIQKVEQDKAKKIITKDTVKSLTDWLNEAQDVFNAYIRERDKDDPCISCGRVYEPNSNRWQTWDAGHYRTVAAAKQLRYNEDNVHKQCKQCNSGRGGKSGNIVEYRIRLVRKIGTERVEALENNNERAEFTIEKAKAIKTAYKAKLKEMKANE